jgi:hypothetical protein
VRAELTNRLFRADQDRFAQPAKSLHGTGKAVGSHHGPKAEITRSNVSSLTIVSNSGSATQITVLFADTVSR